MKTNIEMVVNNSNFSDGIVTYAKNKGVETPEDFFDENKHLNYYTESERFYGMELAVKTVQDGIKSNKKFGIVVDQDFDGYASSAMLYRLLKNEGAEVELISSAKKTHGIESLRKTIIMDHDAEIIMIPDGGVNDYEPIKDLIGRDIMVVVLDHHLINKPELVNNLGAVMVSSQNPDNIGNVNTNFTGAGVVEKFVEAYYGHTDEIYLTLAAVGQIADVSDISDIEIRGLVVSGMRNFNHHPFFKAFELELPVYQSDLGWSVSPMINAVSRCGTLEERLDIVRALSATLPIENTIKKNKRKKNKSTGKFDTFEILVNEYDEIVAMAKRVKNKQEKELTTIMDDITWLLDPKDNKLAIAEIPGNSNSAMTGLIANKLMSRYQQPVFVGRVFNHRYGGSLRSPGQFAFSTWANSHDLMHAVGHEQAAGIEFGVNNIPFIKEWAKELDFNNTSVEVDILMHGTVDTKQLETINRCEEYYGGSVNKPLVGIKGLKIRKSEIDLKKSMISFTYANVQFTMFKAESVINYLIHETGFASDLALDIIADVSETSWGKTMPQLMIKDIAINLGGSSEPEWVF